MGRRDQTISLRDAVYVLFRRRWVILAVAVPIMLVASLGLFKNTGSFVASAKVLVEMQNPEEPRWNPNQSRIDYDRTLSTYQHIAMSVPVAQAAAVALLDSVDAIMAEESGTEIPRNLIRLTEFLLDGLDVSIAGESNILDIRFAAAGTRLSLAACRACRDAFLEYGQGVERNQRAIEFYDERFAAVRARMDSLLTVRGEIVARAGYAEVKEDLRLDANQYANIEDRYYEVAARRSYVEAMLAEMTRRRAENPEFYPVSRGDQNMTTLVNVKDNFDTQTHLLGDLRSRFTEESVQVQRQLEKVGVAREALSSAVDDILRSYEMEVAAAKHQEETLKAQMAEMQAKMRLAPDVYRRASLIDSELAALQKLLSELQVKSGEVLISGLADERVSRFVKLTEPEIELVISGYRKFVYFALITFFGLIFGVVIAFIVDFQDHKLYGPDRMSDKLGVPVLGSVSEADSPRET